jgi:hypothetical protein
MIYDTKSWMLDGHDGCRGDFGLFLSQGPRGGSGRKKYLENSEGRRRKKKMKRGYICRWLVDFRV